MSSPEGRGGRCGQSSWRSHGLLAGGEVVGYGVAVGVPRYFASIARRTSSSDFPSPRMRVTSRVTSRQTDHVAAWLGKGRHPAPFNPLADEAPVPLWPPQEPTPDNGVECVSSPPLPAYPPNRCLLPVPA